MSAAGRFLRKIEGGYSHWCPGCGEMHAFAVDAPNASGARWRFNGNLEQPVFTPSMNIRVNMPGMNGHQADVAGSVCHYFVLDGASIDSAKRRGLPSMPAVVDRTRSYIQFLSDSTHALRGQTVLLPHLPAGHRQ